MCVSSENMGDGYVILTKSNLDQGIKQSVNIYLCKYKFFLVYVNKHGLSCVLVIDLG